jgi:hypothetical protein
MDDLPNMYRKYEWHATVKNKQKKQSISKTTIPVVKI